MSGRTALILLLVVGVVIGALVPGLKLVFVVCAVIGAFLILGAFLGGPATTTGANQEAMLRGRPYTDATEDAMRRAGEHHRGA
jgi:hypothetical protein